MENKINAWKLKVLLYKAIIKIIIKKIIKEKKNLLKLAKLESNFN